MPRLLRRAHRPPEVKIDMAELSADPYPVWCRLRQTAPVVVVRMGRPLWFVTRWDEVRDVVVDDDTYGSQLDLLPSALLGAIPFTDGERHERTRAAIQPHLAPRRSAAFAEAVVPDLADRLLDGLAETPGGDLMAQYAEPLAGLTIRRLLGLEAMPLPELLEWRGRVATSFQSALSGPGTADGPRRAKPKALEEALPSAPAESLLPAIAGALTEDEALAALDTLVLAGVDGFRDGVAQTLLGLLSSPDQLEVVRSKPESCRQAIDEGARWWSPVHTVLRTPVVDAGLGGTRISAGTTLAVSLGSANRDERHWREPERFDLERDEGMHLAFAPGRHHCLGAWLARQAGAMAVNRAIERLPNLRLDPAVPPSTSGWAFHRVHALPAFWG